MMKTLFKTTLLSWLICASSFLLLSNAQAGQTGSAILQISLDISPVNRPAAVAVFQKYRQPFLNQAKGAQAKDLLVRESDVQVIHQFDTVKSAQTYLKSELFSQDVVGALKPLLNAAPEVRVYEQF